MNTVCMRTLLLAASGAIFAASAMSQATLSDAELVQLAAMNTELVRLSKTARPLCVGVKAHVGDPSPAYLATLAATQHRPLVPLSECSVHCPDPANLLSSPTTLLPCSIITAGDAWFDSADQANVSVRFVAGPLAGRNGVYKLRRASESWRVVGYDLYAIH